MSRRFERRTTLAGTRLEQRFSDLFTPGVDSWFDASSYTQDSGTVVSFVDIAQQSHVLTQASVPNQVALPTPSRLFNGALAATFSAHYYDSSRQASSWRHLHDGTGCEAYCVMAPTSVAAGQRVLFATNTNTALAGDTGAEVFLSAAAGVLGISNNGAYPIALSVAAQASVDVPAVFGFRSGTALSTDAVFTRGSGTIASANYGSAVAAGDPSGPLRIGAGVAADRFAAMRWTMMVTFARILTDRERSVLFEYISEEYRV